MSLFFVATILEESFMIRYAPFWLKLETYNFISQSVFTLIKKNLRELSLGDNEHTRDQGFLEGSWRKPFFH